jgi:hypothetical protein
MEGWTPAGGTHGRHPRRRSGERRARVRRRVPASPGRPAARREGVEAGEDGGGSAQERGREDRTDSQRLAQHSARGERGRAQLHAPVLGRAPSSLLEHSRAWPWAGGIAAGVGGLWGVDPDVPSARLIEDRHCGSSNSRNPPRAPSRPRLSDRPGERRERSGAGVRRLDGPRCGDRRARPRRLTRAGRDQGLGRRRGIVSRARLTLVLPACAAGVFAAPALATLTRPLCIHRADQGVHVGAAV